jgi:hypothetical protein
VKLCKEVIKISDMRVQAGSGNLLPSLGQSLKMTSIRNYLGRLPIYIDSFFGVSATGGSETTMGGSETRPYYMIVANRAQIELS